MVWIQVLKGKHGWKKLINGNTSIFTKQENGESNICKDVKRMKRNTHLDDEDADDLEQDKTKQRGAVGPE